MDGLCTVRPWFRGNLAPGKEEITFHRYAMVPNGACDGQDEGAEAMQKGLGLTIAGVAVLSLVAGTGCVTKKAWRENGEATDTRVKGVESGIETQEKRTSDLARDTDTRITQVKGTAERAVEIGSQAMTKAESAEKAARGKIL